METQGKAIRRAGFLKGPGYFSSRSPVEKIAAPCGGYLLKVLC
jgi:hypothetical protein